MQITTENQQQNTQQFNLKMKKILIDISPKDIQMANKDIGWYQVLPIFREMQIKMTMNIPSHPLGK